MVRQLASRAASLSLILKFVGQVFPMVNRELAGWREHAGRQACPQLAEQALASIRDKRFHCQGGSIYSLYEGVSTPDFIRLVVALQTISDYLDNLCDRAGISDEAAFRQLHLAMTAALDPGAPLQDYYRHYPFHDDGGYLAALVRTCQQETAKLPAYPVVKPYVLRLAGLYSELQTYKHLDPTVREAKMHAWVACHLGAYPGITGWEFAAATGSTLGMFMLCAAAANPRLTAAQAQRFDAAYFPWISGLHILLDYFIDAAEDRAHGDLNFVAYYRSDAEITQRLTLFLREALARAAALPAHPFTETVIYGLVAMYLSDPKTEAPRERAIKQALLAAAGPYARFVHWLCRLLRRSKIL